MNSTVISRWLLWRENRRSARRLFYEQFANDLMANMGLIKWISLIGCLAIGMILAPVRIQPSKTVGLSDIKIPARKTLKAGCYNAYFPASATLKKVYQTIESITLLHPRWLEFFGNITDEGFTIKERTIIKEKPDASDWADENVLRESDYRCKPEGLTQTEFAKRLKERPSYRPFKTVKMAGVSYPNESEWKVGKKWQIWFLVEGQKTRTTPPELQFRATYTFQYEIIGRESVTVPAGTFEAFKVKVLDSVNIHVNNLGVKLPTNQTVKSAVKQLHWYAKDIGLVKSLQEGQSKTGLELISVEK
jgi:hypothetical protein